jgi:hypothetical protein
MASSDDPLSDERFSPSEERFSEDGPFVDFDEPFAAALSLLTHGSMTTREFEESRTMF